MTDPAPLDAAALEIAVRGVAIGAFAATAAALAASRRMTAARWIGVLLMVCAIAHVVESKFFYAGEGHFSLLTWALAACAASVFWLFCSVLFEDEPKIPAWRYAAPVLTLALWSVGAYLPPSPTRVVVWQLSAAFSVGLFIHILLMTWKGWRTDLVERRRRLRAPLAVAATGYMFVQTLCDFGFGRGPVLSSMAQAVALAALGLGAALALLRLEPVLIQAPPAADGTPHPRAAERLDLTPADRLVLARLDKAMNESEVWRGEDL